MLDDDIIKERCAEKEAYFQRVQTKNSHLYVLFSVEMNQSSVDVDILVFCLQKKKNLKYSAVCAMQGNTWPLGRFFSKAHM